MTSDPRATITTRPAAGERGAYILESEQWVPASLDEVFPFFADAFNLEAITPSWLSFSVLTPEPVPMKVGQRIDYRLRVRGVPIRWQSEITAWEPPYRFVDEQRRGPYKRWHHEHLFMERGGGTVIFDRVEYALYGGPLAPLVHALIVRADVERIFRYRAEAIAQRLGAGRGGAERGGLRPVRSSA
jgi:ligand-binding SRPBCC domain-containing protein